MRIRTQYIIYGEQMSWLAYRVNLPSITIWRYIQLNKADLINHVTTSGDSVNLTGFGAFSVTERAARTARNPRTGEPIDVAASKAPKFKAGKALKDAVK